MYTCSNFVIPCQPNVKALDALVLTGKPTFAKIRLTYKPKIRIPGTLSKLPKHNRRVETEAWEDHRCAYAGTLRAKCASRTASIQCSRHF
jgi:hypothetical protein